MSDRTFYAYELKPRLKHLTMTWNSEKREIEWIGTSQEWQRAEDEERELSGFNE